MLLKAELSSYLPNRMRMRIPAKRGVQAFFNDVRQRWLNEFPMTEMVCNAATGSVLVSGTLPDLVAIEEFGQRHVLFAWESVASQNHSWTQGVEGTVLSLNQKIQQVTSGRLNLTNGIFLALVIFGVSELIRGNWKTPPWYTAFWYAFGVYSKTLFDQSVSLRN